jgi:hypothetical protein
MSLMTDAPVTGSIGDNAFCGVRVTLDYPAARLIVDRIGVSRARGCQVR